MPSDKQQRKLPGGIFLYSSKLFPCLKDKFSSLKTWPKWGWGSHGRAPCNNCNKFPCPVSSPHPRAAPPKRGPRGDTMPGNDEHPTWHCDGGTERLL